MPDFEKPPGLWRSIRNRQPGRPLWQIAAWYVMHGICFVVCLPLYRYRTWGVRHIPHTGPVLYVANHESFLDAVAIGLGTHRRHYFVMARETLMGNAFPRIMAVLLNAVPVQRGKGDIGGIRACIDVLNDGQALLVYPEGTRTPDGKMHNFKTGVFLIIRKARPLIVPISIAGAYDLWPRHRLIPKLHGRLGAIYAPPIPADDLVAMGPERALQYLHDTIAQNRLTARRRLGLPDEPARLAAGARYSVGQGLP